MITRDANQYLCKIFPDRQINRLASWEDGYRREHHGAELGRYWVTGSRSTEE